MQTTLREERRERVCGLASEIVYLQAPYWCGSTVRQSKLSLMKPRQFYAYDPREERYPLLIFICGGGWMKMDRNVWMPELVYYVKRGFAVAAVEYSTLPQTRHPDQLTEIQAAIRYLRKHAAEYSLMPDQFFIMGESAGGYLAALTALSGEGDTAVRGAVTLYAASDLSQMDNSGLQIPWQDFPALPPLVKKDTPPFLLLHGLEDHQVPAQQSILLYEALQVGGIESDLYLMENADHADGLFYQESVKQIIVDFLSAHLSK